MPIYEQAYRRWQARGPLRRLRSWPITREALRLILSRRAFLVLLAASWVPFLVRLVQVYIVTRFPEAERLVPAGAQLFGEFLNGQLGFAMLLSIFGGAGLVANDLRTGAILVYLSRPLTRRDYVLGKLGVLLALNLAVTLVPGVLLYLASVALLPERFLKVDLAWIGPAVVAQSLLIALAVSLLALAVSSLSRSARVAGVALMALWVGLEIARVVASNVFARPEVGLLSLQGNVQAVGKALFGIHRESTTLPWAWPLLA
ncbi:MAG TPA: ABC transporter permease subunit, partial [Vicinamibacteria bacterium]|nr:ABC transporter permease subunit [Vicinamibacteria bacterium]